MAPESSLVKVAAPEVFQLDKPNQSATNEDNHNRVFTSRQPPKKLPSGVWIYRVPVMVQKCLHWEMAEMFIDSRKLMILQNNFVILIIPILNVRSKIPPSAKCLRLLSVRRVVLCAVNFNGKPGEHIVAQLRLDDAQKQTELQGYLREFRASAPHYHSWMSF